MKLRPVKESVAPCPKDGDPSSPYKIQAIERIPRLVRVDMRNEEDSVNIGFPSREHTNHQQKRSVSPE